jgi:hypothetical protein
MGIWGSLSVGRLAKRDTPNKGHKSYYLKCYKKGKTKQIGPKRYVPWGSCR